MARMTLNLTKTVSGLAVFFLVVIFFTPILARLRPTISGFSDMTCEEGRKPCPEGHFCQNGDCVPVMPRVNIDSVVPY